MVTLKALFYASAAFAATIPKSSKDVDQSLQSLVEQQNDRAEFMHLLDALPDSTLHSVLHKSLSGYKDGVFDHDRAAFEKVHESDPPLATVLLSAAALEMLKSNLAKRSASNDTTLAASSSTPAVASSTAAAPSSAPTSSPAPESSSNEATPSKATPVPPISGVPITTAPSSTEAAATSDSAPSTSNEPAPYTPTTTYSTVTSYTTTDSHGHTYVTSQSIGVVSSVYLETSTLPDGQVVVETTYAIVTATGDGHVGAGATHTGSAPGLQSGSALSTNDHIANVPAIILSCLAGFFALF